MRRRIPPSIHTPHGAGVPPIPLPLSVPIPIPLPKNASVWQSGRHAPIDNHIPLPLPLAPTPRVVALAPAPLPASHVILSIPLPVLPLSILPVPTAVPTDIPIHAPAAAGTPPHLLDRVVVQVPPADVVRATAAARAAPRLAVPITFGQEKGRGQLPAEVDRDPGEGPLALPLRFLLPLSIPPSFTLPHPSFLGRLSHRVPHCDRWSDGLVRIRPPPSPPLRDRGLGTRAVFTAACVFAHAASARVARSAMPSHMVTSFLSRAGAAAPFAR